MSIEQEEIRRVFESAGKKVTRTISAFLGCVIGGFAGMIFVASTVPFLLVQIVLALIIIAVLFGGLLGKLADHLLTRTLDKFRKDVHQFSAEELAGVGRLSKQGRLAREQILLKRYEMGDVDSGIGLAVMRLLSQGWDEARAFNFARSLKKSFTQVQSVQTKSGAKSAEMKKLMNYLTATELGAIYHSLDLPVAKDELKTRSRAGQDHCAEILSVGIKPTEKVDNA